MTNDEDQKFDRFLKTNLKEAPIQPTNEWQMIHKEIYENSKSKKSFGIFSMWPVVTVSLLTFIFIVHNYKSYYTNDVDKLFNISFSTDQSWSSSAALIALPDIDNT